MEERFSSIFTSDNPAESFLKELQVSIATFAAFIPPVENDINELPDYQEIQL